MTRSNLLKRVAVVALFPALLLVLACGGGSDRGGSEARVVETVDEIYDELTAALDLAYKDLNRPQPTFESMSEVQKLAFERVSGADTAWSAGTAYSLSGLPDRVAIYVSRNGEEREGDWYP